MSTEIIEMTGTIAEDVDVATSTEEDETDELDLGKEEQKQRFVILRAKGYSYARIAKELGVSKGTLTAWNTELDAEIARLRAIELEALQEEFFLLKEGRIRLIGEQLKAIQTEIGKRDLSKVNTDKLLELQLRYFGELKGEYVETGQRTRTGPKLNSSDIAEELQGVLARYRAGEIGEAQAKLEEAVLQSMLKAVEQTELAAKVERLAAVIGARR
jgi:transposase-like protein